MNELYNNPATSGNILNGELAELIGKMKAIDREKAAKMKRFSILFSILLVLYGILLITHPTMHLIVIVAGFTLFLGVFLYSFIKTQRRDYTLPVKQLLIQTRRSYRLFTTEFVIVNIGAFPIIYLSLKTLFTRYLTIGSIGSLSREHLHFLIVVVFYFLVLALANYFWRRKYHKLIRQMNECLEELGE